ncbi:MAG TPA: flavodoxin family protein [Candidatus Omnitrophota bacterium]|nr:flavodoxin family protein [Candidatus Omnitrophota bacterium]
MKVIAINGSPRKEWNTATLLKKALEGAASRGAETEFIHLWDLYYKGCTSCFACKEKNGKSYGRCVVNDDLKAVFKRIEEADALVLGSPVYLGNISGVMQSFLERLVFPYLAYTDPPATLFPKKIPTGFIYAMGITPDQVDEFGYTQRFGAREGLLARIFGFSETLTSFDTYQFKDYSKIVAPRFDPVAKLKRRREIFPKDCQKAFELGAKLVDREQ